MDCKKTKRLDNLRYLASRIAFKATRSIRPGAINLTQRPAFPLKDRIDRRSRFSIAFSICDEHSSAVMIFLPASGSTPKVFHLFQRHVDEFHSVQNLERPWSARVGTPLKPAKLDTATIRPSLSFRFDFFFQLV